MELSDTFDADHANTNRPRKDVEKGASVIELLIVVAILLIIGTFSILSLTGHKAMYKTDDQALRIMDLLRAASLRAVTQRQTIRVEINTTTNRIQLIDENQPASAADDVVVRSMTLENVSDVRLNAQPLNITTLAPSPANFPAATFAASVHPSSTSNNVCTIRFRRDGTVVNAGVDSVGTNAAITSMTLFIWPPLPTDATRARTTGAVRAITIFGPTGNLRYWKFVNTSFVLG